MPSPRTFAYPRADTDASGGRGFLLVLAGAVAVGWLMVASELPAPLILPALGVGMVCAGFALAAVLWLSRSRLTSTPSAPWEVACSLVFLGFAAGILGDAAEAVAVLDRLASGLAQRPQ